MFWALAMCSCMTIRCPLLKDKLVKQRVAPQWESNTIVEKPNSESEVSDNENQKLDPQGEVKLDKKGKKNKVMPLRSRQLRVSELYGHGRAEDSDSVQISTYNVPDGV